MARLLTLTILVTILCSVYLHSAEAAFGQRRPGGPRVPKFFPRPKGTVPRFGRQSGPPPPKPYTRVLSIDGNGARNIISCVLLLEVENAIKTHIVEHRPDLLPPDKIVKNANDLTIFVVDYFDVIGGSAGSSWVTLYLSSKGVGGSFKDELKSKEIIDKYGVNVPGTAKALIVYFNEYMSVIFPQPPNPNFFVEPLYPASAPAAGMEALLGDTTSYDLTATTLTPTLDLTSGTQYAIVKDSIDEKPFVGYTRESFSNLDPTTPPGEIPQPIEIVKDVAFKLKDIGASGSAGPTIFPAHEFSSSDGEDTTLFGFDGYMGIAGSPTFMCLSYFAHRTQNTDLSKVATLSLGNGAAPSEFESLANAGIAEWGDLQNRIFQPNVLLAATDVSNFVSLLYSITPGVKKNQYLRIQTYDDAWTARGGLFTTLDQAVNVPALQKIGEKLANDYSSYIASFVEDYIFRPKRPPPHDT